MLKLRFAVCITLLCLALPRSVRADEKLEKLHALVRLPSIPGQFDFYYDPITGYRLQTASDTSHDTADALLKTLHGTAQDAGGYLLVGYLYSDDKQTVAARTAYETGIALLQERLKSVPGDGSVRSRLALGLHQVNRRAERDRALADGIARAPRSAEVWDARAVIEFADANAALSGEVESLPDTLSPVRLGTLLQQPRSTEKVRAALRLLEQAHADYEQAVAAAPDDWHGYSNRWLLRPLYKTEMALVNAVLAGKSASEESVKSLNRTYWLSLVEAEDISDLIRAAQVSRDEPMALGMAAFLLVAKQGVLKPETFGTRMSGLLKHLSAADQKTEGELLARLEKMSHTANPTLAGQSALALGVNQVYLLSPEQARASLRRAQTLLPDNPNVVECLLLADVLEENTAAIQSDLQDALRHRESSRWRLLLAKADSKLNQWEAAAQEIGTALKAAPDDPDLNLAQSALLLHKTDDAAAAQVFLDQLDRARKLMGASPTADRAFSYNYLMGLYLAIGEYADEARKYLAEAKGDDEENANVKAVLALLP